MANGQSFEDIVINLGPGGAISRTITSELPMKKNLSEIMAGYR